MNNGWYTREEIAHTTGLGARTVDRILAEASPSVVRTEPSGRGRPRKAYHYTVHPILAARHLAPAVPDLAAPPDNADLHPATPPAPGGDAPIAQEPVAGIHPADLAMAILRAQAVQDYRQRRRTMAESDAANMTCLDWARRPRERVAAISERLDGGHARRRDQRVVLGGFKPRALRAWAAAYQSAGNGVQLDALAPQRRGAVGRKPDPISEDLLNFVAGMSASTARSDVKKAVTTAREHWPADQFPHVSLDTWRRRIRDLDPRKALRDLNHSVSRFRARHSPDVETDYSALGFNDLWQIDDWQEDWFTLMPDLSIVRPFAYGIVRVATRQWVALVTSQTPIVQNQLRGLVGAALASPAGGIPAQIRFERGTVACDPHLQWLLETLGVRVSRTSMDGGAVHAGAMPDRAVGHFQGKAVQEAQIGRRHKFAWDFPLQVGTEERHTAPARLEAFKAMVQEKAKRGEFVLRPNWHALARDLCTKANSTPHSGLPVIFDPQTGAERHMTPDEMALHLKAAPVRVMPARWLPLFYARGDRVPVTRNGFQLRNHWYGRFDKDLKELPQATVYVNPDTPDLAYVLELGRCVERYEPRAPGEHSEQFADKRRDEQRYRNLREKVMAEAARHMADGALFMNEAVQVLANAVPQRAVETVACPDIERTANAMEAAKSAHAEAAAAHARRFEFPAAPAAPAAATGGARRGLLARSEELRSQVAVISGTPSEESTD